MRKTVRKKLASLLKYSVENNVFDNAIPWKFSFHARKQRDFDTMRLPTKQLINKIENLSNGLTPEQLSSFLDIIDAMTALVEEAGEFKESNKKDSKVKPAQTPLVPNAVH